MKIYGSENATDIGDLADALDLKANLSALPIYKYRTTFQQVDDNTYVDDNTLFITEPAAGVYHFRFELFILDFSSAGAEGVKLKLVGFDAGQATAFFYGVSIVFGLITALDIQGGVGEATAAGDEQLMIVIDGVTTMDGTTDFQLQIACNASSGMRILANSSLEWKKIG